MARPPRTPTVTPKVPPHLRGRQRILSEGEVGIADPDVVDASPESAKGTGSPGTPSPQKSASAIKLEKVRAILEATGLLDPAAQKSPKEILTLFAENRGSTIPNASIDRLYDDLVESPRAEGLDADVEGGGLDPDAEKDEFVPSEPDGERDMPQEGFDDLEEETVDADEVEQEAAEAEDVEVAEADETGAGDDDKRRLLELLQTSQLSLREKKAPNSPLRPITLFPKGREAKEIREFLAANGYKVSDSGNISELPKKKGKKNAPQPEATEAEVLDTDAAEVIEGDGLDDAAPADLEEAPPPERKRTRNKRGRKKQPVEALDPDASEVVDASDAQKQPKGKRTRDGQAKGNWYDNLFPGMDQEARQFAFKNDPVLADPNASREAKIRFVEQLGDFIGSKEKKLRKKAEKSGRKQAKKQEQLVAENRARKRKYLIGGGLVGGELVRELVQRGRNDDVSPYAEPIITAADAITGGSPFAEQEGPSGMSARQELEDRLNGKRGLTGYQRLREMQRSSADTGSSPVDTIRANRGT